MKRVTNSSDETMGLAEVFARRLKAGDVIALTGELGSGKTCFVKGLAKGLGVPAQRYVRSPSFTLINEYKGGRLDLYHMDLYRLTHASELDGLGLEEYMDGDGVTVVEWAEKFPSALPKRAKFVRFEIVDENRRIVVIPVFEDAVIRTSEDQGAGY